MSNVVRKLKLNCRQIETVVSLKDTFLYVVWFLPTCI